MEARDRPWPARDLSLRESVVGYLEFLCTTCVNKLAGLDEAQARATPLPSSPVMSPLGLVKHVTAVLRQHVQIHAAGSDLPSLWRSGDHDFEFRLGPDDTVERVVRALDEEWARSTATLAELDWDAQVEVYGELVHVRRLVVDVLQECARHVGHLDVVRELVDGAKGE
jgi:hypothetical protein